MDTRTELLTKSSMQLMLSLSLPAIIGMVVVGLYNLMDAVFVGQMVGATAMGAISVSYPFTLINSGVATLIGIGSASVLSRAIGEKDTATVDRIMGNLIVLNLVFSTLITVIGMVFTRQILMLSGAQGEILEIGIGYLRIVFAGSLFINFAQSANMIMRGEGLLKKAMLITGTGAVLNIVLDPLFIFIMGKTGHAVQGAAIATIIAQAITGIITIWYFVTKSQVVKIHRIALATNLLPEIFSVGFSAMLMQVMTLLQQTVLYHTAATYGGSTWQIILGASLRFQAFSFIPLWGMSQGFQPAAGTNFGAKKYARVGKLTIGFCLGATVLALVFFAPAELAPHVVLSMFIKDSTIVARGIADFRVLFSSYILLGLFVIVITMFQSLGEGSKASLLVVLRQVILFIPLVLLLPKINSFGIHGVFLAPVITDFIVFILCILLTRGEFKKLSGLEEKTQHPAAVRTA